MELLGESMRRKMVDLEQQLKKAQFEADASRYDDINRFANL